MVRLLDLRRGDDLPEPGRPALDPATLERARSICERVRLEGDGALVALTHELDGADVGARIAVTPEELAAARIDPRLEDALEAMASRLRDLHARQLPTPWSDERDGVRFGETVRPVSAAGCYVPGGRAAYPSTALMTVVPARVAGVARVVVCTPPRPDGSVPAEVLFAARIAGADAVYRIGGAQAVAALAYGTGSVPRVDLVVGPGNAWVTAAKHALSGVVGIDGLAGPTELVLVADGTADPSWLAADLLAQAEHDPAARATLVCTDPALPEKVLAALEEQVAASPRRAVVEAALEGALAVIAAGDEQAAEVAERLAPEHLQVATADPHAFLARVGSYGAAFLGAATPVSFGDYGVGSNHVLPTMGTARFASGLRAADFVRVSSWVEASPGAAVAREVELVARAEGLDGHARASEVRR